MTNYKSCILQLKSNGFHHNTDIMLLNNIKKRFEDKKICTVKVFDFEHRGYIETLFDCYKKSTNK